MEDSIQYKPNAAVVRSARAFIRSLCETYGHTQGMDVWDKIREVLGDQAASDIFLGMLTGDYQGLTVKSVGHLKIEAIKEVRNFTGMGLKEAKDFVEAVQYHGPKSIPDGAIPDSQVDNFILAMNRIGCVVE